MNIEKLPRLSVLPVPLALVALAVSVSVIASDGDHVTARELRETEQILPLDTIVAQAKKEQPGKIIEAELERSGDRYVYELEFLGTDGHVYELYFDAGTGELLSRSRER